jgi:2-methylcitrate dehydratase PrpD
MTNPAKTVLETFAATLLTTPATEAARIDARLRLHFADTVGAMVAGANSAEGREIAGPGGSPALFGPSLFDRIALSVAQTRLTEIDDIHMASCTTVGSVIVPVALKLSAETGADSARLAAGLRAGYDATVRLGCAVDGARILYKGIWPTYLTAPFGAAACAGAILGLTETQMANALALALAQVSGAAGGPSPGRNPRWLLAGWAAAAGVRAALAARDGYGGDRSLLDGDWLAKTHGIAFDASKLAGTPGSSLLDMSMKPWCTAKQACAALAAFIELLDDGVEASSIAAVRIHVPSAYRAMIAHRPPGRIGRIVSIGWQCAVAALHRDELLDIERADHSAEATFAALMDKIEVHADPALDEHFPARYPARVEIETKNGARFERLMLDAPGDPARALDAEGVETKFLRVTQRIIGETHAREIFTQTTGLDIHALASSLHSSSS